MDEMIIENIKEDIKNKSDIKSNQSAIFSIKSNKK